MPNLSPLATCAVFLALGACTAEPTAAPVTVSATDPAYTLCLTGPRVAESDARNPFLHYRMDVAVDGPEGRYTVPGYFAADGDAANTSARAGDQWCARVRGFAAGDYAYVATLYGGDSVALRQNLRDAPGGDAPGGDAPGVADASGVADAETDALGAAGAVGSGMGAVAAVELLAGAEVLAKAEGTIEVTPPADGRTPDGWLRYDTSGFPRFSESGRYFLKTGTNSPENLLAYSDFDGTYSYDTAHANYVRDYTPHRADYRAGEDEGWGEGGGRGLIGALNYMQSIGVNGVYAADQQHRRRRARRVALRGATTTLDRYDVSKLAQWGIVIQAAQDRGIHWQFLTQEAGERDPARRRETPAPCAGSTTASSSRASGTTTTSSGTSARKTGVRPGTRTPTRATISARRWRRGSRPTTRNRHPVVIHTLPDPAIQNGGAPTAARPRGTWMGSVSRSTTPTTSTRPSPNGARNPTRPGGAGS